MAYYPTVRVYVDFAHGPFNLAETWTEVTSYVTGRARYEWGRSSAIGDFQPGKGSYTLVNHDGRFDPSNAAGPYYGTLTPRRRTKIAVTTSTSTYTVAYGVVEGWPQRWEGRQQCFVDISFVDLTSLFSQIKMPESVWDWRVAKTEPLLWYKLGDTETPTASDSSGNNLTGEWRVYEGYGSPITGLPMPKAVLDSGKVASITASSERQAVSWAKLQSEVGQPLGGVPGVPRTPVFVPAWETQNLLQGPFTAILWVLYRQAFPIDIRNIYSSTTPVSQSLLLWGPSDGHYWELRIQTDGYLTWFFRKGSTTYVSSPLGDASLDDGQPHQVCVYYTGSTLNVRVDNGLGYGVTTAIVQPAPVYPVVIGAARESTSNTQSTIGDVIFWDRQVSSTDQALMWYAGRYGSTVSGTTVNDTDAAFMQGFDLAGFAGTETPAKTVTFSDGQLVAETIKTLKGQFLSDYYRTVAATEQGMIFQSRAGVITFHGRAWSLRTDADVIQFQLGDHSSATLGYADLNFRDPADELENDTTVSHPGGSERSVNTDSVADYGPVSGSVDTFLADPTIAKQVANYRVWRFGTPPPEGVIPDLLTIQPNTLAEWDMVAQLDAIERLEITRTRPQGTQIIDEYWVESIAHDFECHSGGEWTTRVGLSLADHPAGMFILNTSLLDGPDVLWI